MIEFIKNKKIILTLIILFGFLLVNSCFAEVIFEDNFNTSVWPNDYNLDSEDYSVPNGWTYANGGTFDIYNSITHYCGEVTSPGREGANDRAFKMWRHGDFNVDEGQFNIDDGKLEYWESDLLVTRELYTRWYMKIPTDFSLAEGDCEMNYLKMWRYYFDIISNGTANAIFIDFLGSSFSSSTIKVTGSVPVGSWKTMLATSEIQDGDWHCHELRIKLNSEGNSDGELQYWLDGVEQAHYTGLAYGADNNEYFSKLSFGLGNTGARTCDPQGEFQSSWRAIEYDDYVLSTTYVGPISSSDTTPPSHPTGLGVS